MNQRERGNLDPPGGFRTQGDRYKERFAVLPLDSDFEVEDFLAVRENLTTPRFSSSLPHPLHSKKPTLVTATRLAFSRGVCSFGKLLG
jgi:hypothetical protein